MLFRHGDVFIARVDKFPSNIKRLPHSTLAEGELTGHSHRIKESGAAEVFEGATERYLRILADQATAVHEEHGPITLPKGMYRVWIQREYTPGAIRRVLD